MLFRYSLLASKERDLNDPKLPPKRRSGNISRVAHVRSAPVEEPPNSESAASESAVVHVEALVSAMHHRPNDANEARVALPGLRLSASVANRLGVVRKQVRLRID